MKCPACNGDSVRMRIMYHGVDVALVRRAGHDLRCVICDGDEPDMPLAAAIAMLAFSDRERLTKAYPSIINLTTESLLLVAKARGILYQ